MLRYKLLYVGQICEDNNITSSTQMFSFGIINELKKINVELVTFNINKYNFNDDIEDCIQEIKKLGQFDFVLYHMLDHKNLPLIYYALKNITKYEVTVFIEVPIGDWKFDNYFFYQDSPRFINHKKYTVYPAPILKDLYNNVDKEKNSILLDHRWQGHLGTNLEKSDDIIEWIKELSNEYKIYKLVRHDEKQYIPDYITPIYHSPFKEYLKMISNKEIFISTHAGSYNSTVIDMLAFGSKCIIPKIDDRLYIPKYNVELFNLPTFSTKEEMLNEIRKPLDLDNLSKQIDKCTSIEYIINDIDYQFRKIINK